MTFSPLVLERGKKLDSQLVIRHLLESIEGYFKESAGRRKGGAALSINGSVFERSLRFNGGGRAFLGKAHGEEDHYLVRGWTSAK